MNDAEEARLENLERSVKQLRRFAWSACILLVILSSAAFVKTQATPSTLTVSELRVIDARGVVRVLVAGEIPGTNRAQGSEGTAGLLLFDGAGAERGGYITTDSSGYIGLTLDARRVNGTTRSTQTAVFRADSLGSTVLRLWNGDRIFEIKADDDGTRYNVLKGRQVVIQEPAFQFPRSTLVCIELRELRAQYDSTAILGACRAQMTDAACKLCLADR